MILAGGAGRRMGGSKATVQLHGRPLISYPLDALRRALGHAVVLAKPDSELPSLPSVTVWLEPPAPRHPLVGILHALEMAGNRPALICAVDLPFVTPQLIDRLARGVRGAPALLAAHQGNSQPLLGWYHPSALAPLQELSLSDAVPVRDAVAHLHPALLEVGDPDLLFNVNGPDDLLQAAAMLDRRR